VINRQCATAHGGFRCAVAAAATVLVAGCGTGLESLPLPAPGMSVNSITVTAVFSNALNLPAKAKVKLNGADIGEVESIHARDFTAQVTMRITADVPVHKGATAQLRSATPLGDVFVALNPDPDPAPGAPVLHDGDVIPVGATTAAATVEDLLSSAALLINGGTIRRLVSIINGTGSAVGGRGDKLAALLHQSDDVITRLNARSAQINDALRSTSELAATLEAHQTTLNETLAAAAPATSVIADNVAQLADAVDAVARITGQLNRLPSLQGTDTRSLIADLNHLSATFNDITVDPTLSMTALNRLIGIMMKSTNATSAHANVDVRKLALGALPDKNYPGDPGFHGADGTDWHAMIGSLRYEWNMLLSRALGPQR
jgi:phospholipid/cholesterol/gamma-HCH transport system substrate-binding protein